MGYVKDALDILDECGLSNKLVNNLDFKLNKRLTASVGRCRLNKYLDKAIIEFSYIHFKAYYEKGEHDMILDTILHEFCHAMPDNNGHDSAWRNCVGIINANTGLNIKRLADDTTSRAVYMTTRTKAHCVACGHEYHLTAYKAKRVNNYGCARCGEKIVLDI